MTSFVSELNYLLALCTIVAQAGVICGFLLFFFARKHPLGEWLSRNGLWIAFLVVLGSSALTLFYSEALGFIPCSLCWLQRVFLYPQVVIFGVALWKKESQAADYGIVLSFLGSIVALYQHYLQMGGAELVPCPADSIASDCAQRIVFEFGYITFPLMSFTVFALIFALLLFVKRREKRISFA